MNDVTIIDQFLNTFPAYIDSGFGLLQGEVAFLTATLIVIDMTIAGLYWAMSHATGQGEDVIAKLLRKVLYVGAFAYIIGNFNMLASIVFRSFAGLGLTASGSTLSMGNFLQPGRLAKAGIDAGAPILEQIREMAGFPEVFIHITPIVVLFLAWLVVIVSFFVLAVQLFITLIEFKLTTLAGFVLVPFALWNKTGFLAEKVLGNVVSSGIKVLVLAVIVGIGSGLFAVLAALRHRLALAEDTERRLAELGARHEAALTALDDVVVAVARIETGRPQAGIATEQALTELRRFAERAGLYGRKA